MANKVVGKLKAVLGLDTSRYNKGVDKAKKKTVSFGKSLKKLAGLAAGGLAIKKIAGWVNKTATLADELGKLSKQTGFSVEQIQKYQFAAERSGISTEKMSMSLQVFQKRLGELKAGTGSLYTRLRKMDPAFMAQLKSANSAQEAFRMYADRMRNASNETEQAALAQAGFSRAGLDMTRLLREGSAGLDRYGQIAENTGGILSGDLVKSAEEYKDMQTDMNMAFRGLKGILMKELMPVIKSWIERIKNIAAYIKEHRGQVVKWVKIIGKLAGALGIAKVAMIALNVVMAANPIGLIITAIAGLIAAFRAAWKKSEKFRAIVKTVGQAIAFFFKKAAIEIKYSFKIMWEKIKGFFKMIGDGAKTIWKTIKAVFQKGKNPADVWRKGFKKIGEEAGKAGEETRKKMNAELAKIKPPNYKKILAKERAKTEAEKTGKEAGESFTKGFQKGVETVTGRGSGGPKRGGQMDKAGGVTGGITAPDSGIDTSTIPQKAIDQMDKAGESLKNIKGLSDRAIMAIQQYGDAYQNLTPQQQRFIDMQLRMKEAAVGASNAIKNATVQMASQFIVGLGKMAAGADISINQILSGVLNTFAGLLRRLGEMAIAVGIGIKGIKESLKSLNPGVAIAAGVALLALAGAVTVAASNLGETGGGGTSKSKGVGMKQGGIVPPGYPNDSYPAMLSSGEKVVPPKKLGMSGGNRKLETSISMRELRIALSENEKMSKRYE